MVGSSSWIVVVVSLLCGVGVGLVAGYLAFPAIREAKRLRIQLDDVLREHETFKTSVNAHFRKTGELVNEMTRSYAAVYDHLASGARTLGGDLSAGSTLPFGPSPELLASPVIESSTDEVAPVAPVAEVAEVATAADAPVAPVDGNGAVREASRDELADASVMPASEPDAAPAAPRV